MRANEFITEVKLDIPDQTISVQIPLRDIIKTSPSQKENPGERIGTNGATKWSPPLQQHLDTMKDMAGPSDDDVSLPDDNTTDTETTNDDLQQIIALISKMTPSII